MSSPGPFQQFQQFQQDCAALIYDIDDKRDVDDRIWATCIANAMQEMGIYSPLRRQTDVLNVSQGQTVITLPTDFLAPDIQSFNSAVNPSAALFSYRSFIYTLESTTSAASDLPAYFSASPTPFNRMSVFEFTDDGTGGKILTVEPGALQPTTIQFLYFSSIPLTDAVSGLTPSSRPQALYRATEQACVALAALFAGDRVLHANWLRLADRFRQEFEKRTRFRPVGYAG
jgi:hypothetical protein